MVNTIPNTATPFTDLVNSASFRKASDEANIAGAGNDLHIRSGFERFKDAVTDLFTKKTPERHQRVADAVKETIKAEFGARIADAVVGQNWAGGAITAGDLRKMQQSAVEMQMFNSNFENSVPATIPFTSATMLIDSGRKVDQIYGQLLANKSNGTDAAGLADYISDSAKAFSTVDLRPLGMDINDYVKSAAGGGAPDAALKPLVREFGEASLAFEATDNDVAYRNKLNENFEKYASGNTRFNFTRIQDGYSLGPQLGMRLGMLQDTLTGALAKFAKLNKDPDAAPDKLQAARNMVHGATTEIAEYVSTSVGRFEDIGRLFAAPEMQTGMTPAQIDMANNMSKAYANLARALKESDSPAQQFVAFSLVKAHEVGSEKGADASASVNE